MADYKQKTLLSVDELLETIPRREQKAATVKVGRTRITWFCEKCGSEAKKGFIWSPYRDTPFQKWYVHCRECDPEVNGEQPEASYWFHVERCSTLGALLRWQDHLSQKLDFNFENWSYFIENIARAKSMP